jgi:hypothetical protein
MDKKRKMTVYYKHDEISRVYIEREWENEWGYIGDLDCISRKEYGDMVNIINGMRLIGNFVIECPANFIIGIGKIIKTTYYQDAVIDTNESSDKNKCVRSIDVQYFEELKGIVEKKNEISDGAIENTGFVIKICGNNVFVTKEEFDKINIGNEGRINTISSDSKLVSKNLLVEKLKKLVEKE